MARDLLAPEPAFETLTPPPARRLAPTRGDIAWMAAYQAALLGAAGWAAGYWDPWVGLFTWIGGTLAGLESFLTGLGYLDKNPQSGTSWRWTVLSAALVPWVIGLGATAGLITALFSVSDWIDQFWAASI